MIIIKITQISKLKYLKKSLFYCEWHVQFDRRWKQLFLQFHKIYFYCEPYVFLSLHQTIEILETCFHCRSSQVKATNFLLCNPSFLPIFTIHRMSWRSLYLPSRTFGTRYSSLLHFIDVRSFLSYLLRFSTVTYVTLSAEFSAVFYKASMPFIVGVLREYLLFKYWPGVKSGQLFVR